MYVTFNPHCENGYEYHQGTLRIVKKKHAYSMEKYAGDTICDEAIYMTIATEDTHDRIKVIAGSKKGIKLAVQLIASMVRRMRWFDITRVKDLEYLWGYNDAITAMHSDLKEVVKELFPTSQVLVWHDGNAPVGLSIMIDNEIEIPINPNTWDYTVEEYFIHALSFDKRIPLMKYDNLISHIDDSKHLEQCTNTITKALNSVVGASKTKAEMVELKRAISPAVIVLLEHLDDYDKSFYKSFQTTTSPLSENCMEYLYKALKLPFKITKDKDGLNVVVRIQ